MATVLEHVRERSKVNAGYVEEVAAGRMTTEVAAQKLSQWDKENPSPSAQANAASAPKPPAPKPTEKPKGVVMATPDQEGARKAILDRVAKGELSAQDAGVELDRLSKAGRRGLFCKVSPKEAMSLYGLQRMPVTLYVEQWERLLAFADELRRFMAEHDKELSRKPVKA